MFTLNCKGRLLVVDKPLLMGIINVTPDSFYGKSRHTTIDAILLQAEKMLQDGATFLDIGGQSTRPGSVAIDETEELKRVLAPVETIARNFPEAIISVDTYYASVASAAVEAGASLVNDISAGSIDEKMIPMVASLKVPYVLMHMQGTPSSMQQQPRYENVTKEVLDFFISRMHQLRLAGIHDIIIDPGIGFGKTIAHNFELLRNLSLFGMTGQPLLLGVSRKGTVYKVLDITADEALNGTTVLHTIGLMNGASILRVHDVKEAAEAIKLFMAYRDITP